MSKPPAEVTPTGYRLLRALPVDGAAMARAAVAAAADVSSTNLRPALDRLIQSGHIETREALTSNARGTAVAITPKGRAAIGEPEPAGKTETPAPPASGPRLPPATLRGITHPSLPVPGVRGNGMSASDWAHRTLLSMPTRRRAA